MPTQKGRKKLIIDLPAQLKTDFQVHCVLNQVPMTEVVEMLIREYLKGKQPNKGAM